MLIFNFLKIICVYYSGIILTGFIQNNTFHHGYEFNNFIAAVKTGLHLLIPFITIYSINSIPFGLISHHLFKTADPRQIGSGNIGTTNMMRTGNKKAALLTLIGDFLKGYGCCILFDLTHSTLPTAYITKQLAMLTPHYVIAGSFWILIPVLAHIYPVWLNFKGGKGIATAFGILLAYEWRVGILGIVIWIITFLITRISAVAGIAFVTSIPVICYNFLDSDGTYWTIVLAVIIIFTHRTNISSLTNGGKNSKLS